MTEYLPIITSIVGALIGALFKILFDRLPWFINDRLRKEAPEIIASHPSIPEEISENVGAHTVRSNR